MNIVARMERKSKLSVFVYQIKQCALGISPFFLFLFIQLCGSWDVFSKNWKVLMKIRSNENNDQSICCQCQKHSKQADAQTKPPVCISFYFLVVIILLPLVFLLSLYLAFISSFSCGILFFFLLWRIFIIYGCPMVFTMMSSMHREKKSCEQICVKSVLALFVVIICAAKAKHWIAEAISKFIQFSLLVLLLSWQTMPFIRSRWTISLDETCQMLFTYGIYVRFNNSDNYMIPSMEWTGKKKEEKENKSHNIQSNCFNNDM